MTVDKDRLGQAIIDALEAGGYTAPGADLTDATAVWKVIADEVLKELKTNAVITGTAGADPIVNGAIT